MNLSAVAWDIDGTLADSEGLHHRALLAASAIWGIDLSDLPDRAFSGVHMRDVWRALAARFPSDVAEAAFLTTVEDYYAGHSQEIVALPGAIAAIEGLAARGIRQVCVSNSSRRVVDANLDALAIRRRIAFSISLDDVAMGKPDPEPYRRACELLGLAPSSALAVEDSQTGARSARAAGLFVIGFAPSGQSLEPTDMKIDRLLDVLDFFDAGLDAPARRKVLGESG
ncbi:HAD family phosphatase [Methylocapsa sp. S129]|uniref:HAD family hydrolase n=1 Tax=Methylocapsa sp. S129 TaxID=1641869 RepID=UPI00131D8349|nr:HAD family phosphatase [Methylocapsa sp. S129]